MQQLQNGWKKPRFDGQQYREFRLAYPLNQTKSATAYEVLMGAVQVGLDEISCAAGFSWIAQITIPPAQVHPREVQDSR